MVPFGGSTLTLHLDDIKCGIVRIASERRSPVKGCGKPISEKTA